MSLLSAQDEAELQALLKQLLRSVQDRICSSECVEETLLRLEETDKNFHNYQFVKFLRQLVENSVGSVVEDETDKFSRGEPQHAVGSDHDALVHAVSRRTRDSQQFQQMMQSLQSAVTAAVASLSSRLEEDQLRRAGQRSHSNADNCSDSDSSFNQSYAFIRQEQLQVLADKLEAGQPRQERLQALQLLCSAPPSDVLSCESWSFLRRNLSAALSDDDPELSDLVLQFFSRSFSSSPLNVTREIYTSLGQTVESSFRSLKMKFPSGSSVLDLDSPKTTQLLKQIRLMNDFQKEVTTFWIRHPEKYMEDVIEGTFSLLSLHPHPDPAGPERLLEPVHLLALLDLKATWFKRWMHGYYSRTVVLRLLEGRYRCLVVSAVQQCVRYSEACQRLSEDRPGPDRPGPDRPGPAGPQTHGPPRRTEYSGAQLDYACFVHSLCMLGRILLYAGGRKLFPVRTQTHRDPLALTDVIVLLINIMFQSAQSPPGDASHSDCVCPSVLVMELLGTLCERDECSAECLLQDSVLQTLLDPVLLLLRGQQVGLRSPAAVLTLVAEVLAAMATTARGLGLFLHRENLQLENHRRTSAAHVLVRFCLRLLDGSLPAPGGSLPAVGGAYISVCRQLYNTCEGLQVLQPYAVHRALAAAWRQVSSTSDRVSTPGGADTHSMLGWEETLLDGLLSFAATPRGLLLLQQTGALGPSVALLFSRCSRKLQVSRWEKFGYGVMVTQLAATAPGVRALQHSGLVAALVTELWWTLECGGEGGGASRPSPTAMEPIDRRCLKSFLSLVNLLSSPRSVWELLSGRPLANRTVYPLRDAPSSVPELIDRLVAVDSDVKIRSLFHYEQSHTFGLRLLSVLCCSLDSFLLLEAQYGVTAMLLQNQRENTVEPEAGPGALIVDGLSVERNQLLVRVGVVGGPSERVLPPRVLQEGASPYPWPMVSSFPVPGCYSLGAPPLHAGSRDSELAAFLSSPDRSLDQDGWMDACRTLFRRAVTAEPRPLSGEVLSNLLEEVVSRQSDSFFSPAPYKAEEKNVKNVVLSAVELLGIQTCVRYGGERKLLAGDSAPRLSSLMKHLKTFLSSQRLKPSPQLGSVQDYPGYDWLAATVFLLMGGDPDRSLRLLLKLSGLLVSAVLWPARVHQSAQLPRELVGAGLPPLYCCSAHYLEMLLKAELPLVHSAFRMSGFTPSQVCLHWLTQCFWNFLDWTEVSLYVTVCVLMGPDYQVYMCVALLRHLEPQVLQHTQEQDLQLFLKEEPIRDFRLADHWDFMVGLERSYRDLVLGDMKTVLQPAP